MKHIEVMQSSLLSRTAMSECGLELAFSDEDTGCPSNVRDSWNYKLPSTMCMIDQGPGKPCGGGWEQAGEGLLLSCIKEEGNATWKNMTCFDLVNFIHTSVLLDSFHRHDQL